MGLHALDLSVKEMADAHLIQPYDMLDRPNTTMVQAGGRGIYLITDKGEKIIDGPGGMWNVNVGYGEARLAEAIGAQALKMAYNSPWHNTSGPAAQLAHKLASLAPPGLNRVFFTTGGSTAVDTALQFVAYRNNFLGRPHKKLILARENAFHGSSYLSASVSFPYAHMDQATEMVARLQCPDPNDAPEGATLQEWEDILVANLEAVIAERGAENIGAMIAEPIMGAGGVIVPPPGYLRRCQRVCTALDIVFIADEVVTAFGRLGHYFASEAVFGIEPDIICFAKGVRGIAVACANHRPTMPSVPTALQSFPSVRLVSPEVDVVGGCSCTTADDKLAVPQVTSGYIPLGGLLISDRMLATLDTDGSMFTSGFTYSGHPVACAAALANLKILEDDKLLEHVRRTGSYFQRKLREQLEPLLLVRLAS